jgi:hypothetical protein
MTSFPMRTPCAQPRRPMSMWPGQPTIRPELEKWQLDRLDKYISLFSPSENCVDLSVMRPQVANKGRLI